MSTVARRRSRRNIAAIAVCVVFLLVIAAIWAFVYEPWAQKEKYMLKYQSEILSASREFDLDPYLLAAMIYCESSYRADVVSHANAVGLMQVTPETGAWIAPKLGITDFEETMLVDPAVNVRLGSWYVRFLLDRYDQQEATALTGYIAGQGMVDRLLQDATYSQDGKTLDLAKFEGRDTREYAVKVLNMRENYKKLYPDGFEGL